MRTLSELINTQEHAWNTVTSWLAAGENEVLVEPASRDRGERALLHLQVTTRSPLGAVALEASHIRIDHRWLTILGAGTAEVEGLVEWNPEPASQGFVIVAHDVLGGFFGLNGGRLPGAPGSVAYFAPDSLEWEAGELGYSQFVHWAASAHLAQFYAGMRWNGWQEECGGLGADQGILVYPFLSARGPDIGERHRGAVPMRELWDLWHGPVD